MTELVWAIDVSNWQGDISSLIDQHKPQHVVVRASTESDQHRAIARQQLETALAKGCSVSIYIWVYFDLSPAEHVQDALSTAAEFPLALVWLDCEGESANGRLDDWLSRAVAQVESQGYRAGIYTSLVWWEVNGDSQGFARLPLWLAQWDNDPSLDSVHLPTAWASAVGKQWSTDGGIDRNVFDAAILTSPPDPCAALRAGLAAELARPRLSRPRLRALLEIT